MYAEKNHYFIASSQFKSNKIHLFLDSTAQNLPFNLLFIHLNALWILLNAFLILLNRWAFTSLK
jgi:hypothetical protein